MLATDSSVDPERNVVKQKPTLKSKLSKASFSSAFDSDEDWNAYFDEFEEKYSKSSSVSTLRCQLTVSAPHQRI